MKRQTSAAVLAWAALLLAAGVLSSCGSSSPYRNHKQLYRDTEIEADVMSQFQQAPGMTDVAVVSFKGEVTLTGEVGDPQLARKAEELARTVPGVRKVLNQVSVRNGSPDRIK